MSRICLIGDSHLGVLQSATQGSTLREICQLTFFCCHVQLISGLTLEGRKLVPGNAELAEKLREFSGGLDHIDIDAYDRFVIVGHFFNIHFLVGQYRGFVADSMQWPVQGKYLISDDCFATLGEQAFLLRPSFRLAHAIRSVCDKPITVIPDPNPSEGFPEKDLPDWFPPFHDAVRNGDADAIAALFREVCARLAKKLGIKVVPPLPEAAANSLFNLFEYSRLNGEVIHGHLLNAMMHANGLYGALLLPHVFEPAELSAAASF